MPNRTCPTSTFWLFLTSISLTIPETSVEMPTLSASTYALSVDITRPPVTYQYPAAARAIGSNANDARRTQRRRGDRGAFLGSADVSVGRSDCARGGRSGCSRAVSRLAAGASGVSERIETMVASAGMQTFSMPEWTWL